MANQQNSYTGSQGTGTNNADFAFTFPSFTTGEVKVEVDNVVKTLTTHYTVEDYNTTSGGKVRFTTNNIPSGTTPVRIFRQTDVDTAKATFTAGSSLKAGEINDNFKQVRHALQEAIGAVATDRKVQEFNIEDGAITSAKIKDLTIVEDDIANSAVTQNKLDNNSVGTPELINGSVNSDKILDGTIVNVDVNASAAIAGTKISPNFGSQNIVTTGTISTGSFTTSGTVDGRDIAADGTKLDTIETNAKDDQTAAEIKTLLQSDKLTASEIATGALDGRYFTETELNNGALDGRYFTETEADARYFNISTGDTIKDGDSFPDNDTTIATTAAINDRIIDLVDDVGGFVPIANETSFPTANPDVNNGAGTLVSIKAIGSTRTPSTGTVTIANGSGSNTVTITGCGSTVLTAGFGVIVETTTTLHTYAFHRLVPKATEVTTVAGISSNVTTVATNIADINTVAADLNEGTSEIDTVATNIANVNTVGNAIANVNTTAGSIANVNTTAGSITNVNNVGNNISNVNSVAGNESNINSAVSNASNINSAVSNASNINTVAGSISNVNTTAGSISNVNTVASNISNVNNFNDVYQINANDPTTDGGGNALAEGDLYFNTSADRLKVYNGSSWVNGVEISGSGAVTTGNTFTGDNRYNDGVKALFGTGSDLEVYHNGNNSHIDHVGTGDFFIRTIGSGDKDLYLRANNDVFIKPQLNENGISVIGNGQVELYYDAAKKLETNSTGAKVYGSLLVDSVLDISPPGNNAVLIKNPANGIIGFGANNQSNQVIITTDGHLGITGDNKELRLGASEDFKIYHNTSNYIDSITGHLYLRAGGGNMYLNPVNNETGIAAIANGAVELYHNNNKKLETTSSGISVTGNASVNGNVTLPDEGSGVGKLILGDGSDLQIYHDGTHSYLTNTTGDLRITDTTGLLLRSNSLDLRNGAGDENYITCAANGGVELYYDHSKKFETLSTGAAVTGELDVSGSIDMNTDTGRLKLGAGDDLSLWHDGSNSYIANTGGQLRIWAKTDGYAITCTADGSVDLYHNNSKKFETTSSGVSVTGNIAVSGTVDGVDIAALNTTVGNITTDVVSDTSPQLGGNLDVNGNAILLGDTADTATGTASNRIRIGAGQDLQLFHGPNNSYIRSDQGSFNIEQYANATLDIFSNHDVRLRVNGGETAVDCSFNGSVDLYYDNSKKLETVSNGVYVYGDLLFGVGTTAHLYGGDNNKVILGSGSDFQLYHDGSNSYITNTTGILHLRGQGTGIRLQKSDGEPMVYAIPDGAVQLYYDQTEKAATASHGMYFGEAYLHHHVNSGNSSEIRFTTAGVRRGSVYADNGNTVGFTNPSGGWNARWHSNGNQTSHGHIKPNANNSYDLGDTSYRWRNIYTNDLHLSNEGSSNEVDGTWGDWTIQEGESDLFLKNNRSGKKYKFNLMEVS